MKKQTKLGLVLAAAAVISVSVASLVSARGWVQQGADWYYVDNSGEYVTDTIQSSGNAKFYLGEEGTMQRDYLLQDYNGNTYYFGSNGAMVTNTWVAVDSTIVESNADYIPDNFWFYFQGSGKAVKGASGTMKKTTIDGKKYAFSEDGTMLTGWIKSEGKTVDPDEDTNPFVEALYYGGGDNDGVLRAGWVTYYDGYDGDDTDPETDYDNLYFYFNTSNNKKYGGTGSGGSETKKINGKTYAFSDEGVMLSGWDAYEQGVGKLTDHGYSYFSDKDDGHQVKKGWIYAVPAAGVDSKAHDDDEEKYMYFNASGDIVKDTITKKVNGKYYAFNTKGIMKTGIVVWGSHLATTTNGKFVATLDLDWAKGEDITKKGILRYDSDEAAYIKVNPKGKVLTGSGTLPSDDATVAADDIITLHYFGDDGARKTGSNNIEFADDTFTFVSTANGHKPSGSSAKKYYSLGIQLKASADVKYGIYANTISEVFAAQKNVYAANCLSADKYIVLNTSGSKVKGKNQSFKDSDGNYWLLDANDGFLKGIWSVSVKVNNAAFVTRTFNYGTTASMSEVLNGKKYLTTAELNAFSADGDLFDTSIFTYNGYWKINGKADTEAGTCKFSSVKANGDQQKINTVWFQGDYGDKSNVWLPFGTFDNAQNTCSLNFTVDDDSAQNAYVVIIIFNSRSRYTRSKIVRENKKI